MFLQADHARRLKPRAVPSEAAGGRLVEAAQAAFAMRSPPVYGPGGLYVTPVLASYVGATC
jgi:hypothetical protein